MSKSHLFLLFIMIRVFTVHRNNILQIDANDVTSNSASKPKFNTLDVYSLSENYCTVLCTLFYLDHQR